MKILAGVFVAACALIAAGYEGVRVHRFAVNRWPSIDRLLPKDVGAVLGLLAGATALALWWLAL